MTERTVIVAIPVHFSVTAHDDDITKDDARRAAEAAVYHHLSLIDHTGRIPFAQLKVDGIGICDVGLADDEEDIPD